MELKAVFDNVRFEHKDDFLVMGIETDIDYKVKNGNDGINVLYERWNEEGLLDKIPDKACGYVTYGMTHESTEDDTAKYLVGTEVSTLEHLPAGLIGRRFEGGEFAVFRTTLSMEISGEFWRYFYGTWLQEQGLTQPDAVLTRSGNHLNSRPNYEVYDEHFVN